MASPDGHIFPQQSAAEYLGKLWRPAEMYHENSKLTRADAQSVQRARHDPLQRAYAANTARRLQECAERIQWGAKRYPQCPRISLPPVPRILQCDIGTVLWQRQSVRHFSAQALSLSQLTALLFFSYGITRYADPQHQCYPRRVVPSGGGIYPLEVYVLAFNVADLPPGVYHYEGYSHALEQMMPGDCRGYLAQHFLYDELAHDAALALVLGGIFERPRFKYGELSYRLILLEAGHVGQNICLVCTALGLGGCPVAGFVEDGVNVLLGMNGVDESALYLFVVGKTPEHVASAPHA
jgi:SagB-type dehydrogenase family enzyme